MVHFNHRQQQIIRFALEFLQANMGYISDMLEEAPSETVGSNIGSDEIETLIDMHKG